MKQQVSVVIITKNQKSAIKKTLESLKTQSYTNYETIIVDSGSTDGSQKLYQKYGVNVVGYNEPLFNYAKALNLGVSFSAANIIARLSGDSIPANNNWLYHLTQPFNNKNVGGVYGPYLHTQKANLYWKIFCHPLLMPSHQKEIRKFPIIAGGNFAFRKSIWNKRPFDETFKYGEDAEYGFYILSSKHHIIYQPKALTFHEHNGALNSLKSFYQGAHYLSKLLSVAHQRKYFKYLY